MKNMSVAAGILSILICCALFTGCATIDVDDPNAAIVNVEYKDFPKSMLGNKPFIQKLDDEYLVNIYKKKFQLMPGRHTAQVAQKSFGVNHTATVDFSIPKKGTYTLVITKTGGNTSLIGTPTMEVTFELTGPSL